MTIVYLLLRLLLFHSLLRVCFFFFFKQKTAYEMRISDWSSDVCSSDLSDRQDVAVEGVTGVAGADCHRDRLRQGRQGGARQEGERGPVADEGRQHTGAARLWGRDRTGRRLDRADDIGLRLDPAGGELGRASCRGRVSQYVLNSVVAGSLKKK